MQKIHVVPQNTSNQEHKIRVLPRLSPFNRKVQFHLSKLKRNERIFDHKLKGYFHCYQSTENAEWFTVLNDEHLDLIAQTSMELIDKHKNKNKQKTGAINKIMKFHTATST